MRSKNNLEDKTIKIFQRDKIDKTLQIIERPDLTEKQKEFIKTVLDKNNKIIFVNGPAGCSKTYLSIYCGLHLLNQKKISDILYFRTIIESASKELGFLPGEISEKFSPFAMPMMDKLEELLPSSDIKYLLKDERIKAIPINYLRGASYNAKYIFLDEAQNTTFSELTTAITRFGSFSKMIIAGDIMQSDINGKSGFKTMFSLFNDDESKKNGIVTYNFTKEDIVRSEVLKFIIERIENRNNFPLIKT